MPKSNTYMSISKWSSSLDAAPRVVVKADTSSRASHDKIMLSGKLIEQTGRGTMVQVSVEPAAVEKKLAIRRMNEKLEGRTIKSTTFKR